MTNKFRIELEDLAYIQVCRVLLDMDDEFLFVLLGKVPSSRKILVEEVLFPFQEVSGGTCKIKEKGLIEMSKVTENVVGWGHSHDNFGAFHSKTDQDTGKLGGLLSTPFASITVAKSDGWDARVFTENGGSKAGLDADLYLPEEVHSNKFSVSRFSYVKGTKAFKAKGGIIYVGKGRVYPDVDDYRPWWQRARDKLFRNGDDTYGPYP